MSDPMSSGGIDDLLNGYLSEEEALTHSPKLSQHARHVIIRNAKLSYELTERAKKAFPTRPTQWLACGMSMLFNIVHDYLEWFYQSECNAEDVAAAKNRLRLSFLAQTARIIAMIDAYPDDYSKFEGFRNLSHDQLRQYLDEEYKKWLA